MLDLPALQTLSRRFTALSPWNRIDQEEAISPELSGVCLFDAPLMGCSEAADPLYETLLQPEVVGPQVLLPAQWLPGARSVLSFFFPFSQAVRQSNRGGDVPSSLWLHGRIEGQRFIGKFAEYLTGAICDSGARAVAPVFTDRFQVNDVQAGMPFGSNWSERHVAFISGLGTFGLSKGLITERGMAGRFVSIVTDLALPPTQRPYQDIYEYCTRCGACVRQCPANAISLRSGKDHSICSAYQEVLKVRFAPRFGCGKCQVGVPCEFANPSAGKKAST